MRSVLKWAMHLAIEFTLTISMSSPRVSNSPGVSSSCRYGVSSSSVLTTVELTSNVIECLLWPTPISDPFTGAPSTDSSG
eukprot:2447762-Prymnesium_polylepis.1